MSNELNYRELNEILEYFPETGDFLWKKDIGCSTKAGQVAGSKQIATAPRIQITSKQYDLKKIAWTLLYRSWPLTTVYQINKDCMDLRKVNLTLEKPEKKKGRSKNIGDHVSSKSLVASPVLSSEKSLVASPVLSKEELQQHYNDMPVLNETKPLVNGRKRLTEITDLPEMVQCFCPKCLRTYYKPMINYTGNVPYNGVLCKNCGYKIKKQYSWTKVLNQAINTLEHNDYSNKVVEV